MSELTIGNVNVVIKEYQGQRVVTLKDIDTVHQRPDGTARRNFNTNKQHFIEGVDYFKIPTERNSYGWNCKSKWRYCCHRKWLFDVSKIIY